MDVIQRLRVNPPPKKPSGLKQPGKHSFLLTIFEKCIQIKEAVHNIISGKIPVML